MKAIRLYNWEDKQKKHCLREVRVLKTESLTRNKKERIFVWSTEDEECNYTLYPDYGTAYPEYESRIQLQRIGEVFWYDVVE